MVLNQHFIQDFIRSGSIITLDAHRVLIGWGKRSLVKDPAKISGPVFYFPDFFLKNESQWYVHEHWKETDLSNLQLHVSAQISSISKPAEIHWTCPYHEVFRSAFHDLQHRFGRGELQKAVPYVFMETPNHMDMLRLAFALDNLLKYAVIHPVYLYGCWDRVEGILGATPELLFRLRNHPVPILETMACAGTCATNHEDTLDNPKELHEHQLVVQGITESLDSYGEVCPKPLELLKLPNLTHLVTPIQVKLDHPIAFESAVRALHPTPALGAFPKAKGNLWLNNYQTKIARKRFGAPVGFMHNQGSVGNCYVAIRNVQWDEKGMKIGAGCGIVSESRPEKEWQEIQLKHHAIRNMMSL